MAKAQICLSFIIFLYMISSGGSFMMRVNASQGQWCVAKPGTGTYQLLKNAKFVCSRMDCKIVYKGGSCYTPDSIINMSSVVMNLYYQDQGRQLTSCDFDGSATIVVTDPSYGSCIYEFKQ